WPVPGESRHRQARAPVSPGAHPPRRNPHEFQPGWPAAPGSTFLWQDTRTAAPAPPWQERPSPTSTRRLCELPRAGGRGDRRSRQQVLRDAMRAKAAGPEARVRRSLHGGLALDLVLVPSDLTDTLEPDDVVSRRQRSEGEGARLELALRSRMNDVPCVVL